MSTIGLIAPVGAVLGWAITSFLLRNSLEPVMTKLNEHPEVLNTIEGDWGTLSKDAQQKLVRVALEEVAANVTNALPTS